MLLAMKTNVDNNDRNENLNNNNNEPIESLNDKIARKDKLIQEQMKLIQELANQVETLSRQSRSRLSGQFDDFADDYNNGTKDRIIITQSENDLGDSKQNLLVSFEPFFTTATSSSLRKISPLTIERDDADE